MGFSRQEYWSGLPLPSPEDLPNPGIKAMFLKFPALAGGFFTTSATWEDFLLVAFYSITFWPIDPLKFDPISKRIFQFGLVISLEDYFLF